MNENLNLIEILKDCPKGTKLYSTILGEVEFQEVTDDFNFPITVRAKDGDIYCFTLVGRIFISYEGECLLFPSKDQRDWGKFKSKKQSKFDPKTIQPFDKVLARDSNLENWSVQFFSYISEYDKSHPYACIFDNYRYCIPYNDNTKHLIGTTEEAPEYYRYLED